MVKFKTGSSSIPRGVEITVSDITESIKLFNGTMYLSKTDALILLAIYAALNIDNMESFTKAVEIIKDAKTKRKQIPAKALKLLANSITTKIKRQKTA
ncbi:TPA: hypothetical protein DDW69_02410 [candidate division CPR2 bacterium]|uniref:Uncharacterized protein n=1 Tax=candidate division CPR2 bacterium GW2011_GWC1_41_48 TaxID=1618344 RepID=A0A0G0WA45_UNCC2|nr:MAG: hypothetical protein UT47_C0001G0284 [candidate division CPR2 bacterium GW2011_GWC2_39_35]KKR28836.1 MAG: hypothetical protein UT60_C0011G0002 [candidate division CPR2 bacterium GW2011_GWD2_39_7]KKS09879.1 MAG: hypothetical protein UU65_C0001G0284 [candidate division CPR2 bacterium GW2011_GWC1_41_48]OGB73181.1 MAG: hypothetical protein A2Y26_01145 [candidate division CPR2 bacterium GWD2_39_7]HBG81673.1 hypothetical protein [candidate division CPR2 bacterium]